MITYYRGKLRIVSVRINMWSEAGSHMVKWEDTEEGGKNLGENEKWEETGETTPPRPHTVILRSEGNTNFLSYTN